MNEYIGDTAYMDIISSEIEMVMESGECHFDAFERLEFVHRKYRELETAINRVKQCTVYHADDFPEYTTIYKSKDIEDAMEIDDE